MLCIDATENIDNARVRITLDEERKTNQDAAYLYASEGKIMGYHIKFSGDSLSIIRGGIFSELQVIKEQNLIRPYYVPEEIASRIIADIEQRFGGYFFTIKCETVYNNDGTVHQKIFSGGPLR